MKKSKFTEEQILFALKQGNAGQPVSDACRQMGIREATYNVCKSLMRMLYWRVRLSLRGSSRFPGGTRRSSRVAAGFSMASLRKATCFDVHESLNALPLVQAASVSEQLKDLMAE
jgi:hypothetical protein